MIVQCDKCWTKFRIADQKVTEAGVKVRCSRCAHVFMVKRPPSDRGVEELEAALRDAGLELMPPVAQALGGAGPGSQLPTSFGSSGSSQARAAVAGTMPGQIQSALPGALPPGAGSRVGSIEPNAFPSTQTGSGSRGGFPPGPASVPSSTPFVSTQTGSGSRGGFPPPGPAQAPFVSTQTGSGVRAGFPPPSGAPGAQPSMLDLGGADPLASLGFGSSPPSSQPPGFAPVPVPSAQAEDTLVPGERRPGLGRAPKPLPQPSVSDLLPGSPGGLGFEGPSPGSQGGRSGGAAFPPPPGFDFLGGPSSAPPPATASSWSPSHASIDDGGRFPPLAPPGSPAVPDLFSGADFGSQTRVPTGFPTDSRPRGAEARGAAHFPPPAGDVDRFPASVEASDPAQMFPPPSGFPFGGSGSSGGNGIPGFERNNGELSQVPSIVPNLPGDDPFAGLDLDQSSGHSEEGWNDATRPVGDLDLSGAGSARSEGPKTKEGASLERGMAATRVASDMFPRRATESGKAKPLTIEPPAPRWPTFAGLVLGGIITLLAVLGPARGDLSRFDPEDLVALVRNPFASGDRALSDVEVRDAQVSLYPGKNGRKLLVIAGEAYNGGSSPVSGVEAVATVRDTGDVLEQRDARLGVTLTEDTLSEIQSPAELETALARARATASDRVTLEPGASLPFMVIFVFQTPPDDLEQRAFHVEFRQGEVAETP